MLPDDPKQFNDMFATYVFPYLLTLAGNNVVSRIMRAFGMNRQEAEKRLGELLNNKNPSLWVSEKNGELFIRVTAGMATEQESLNACNAMIKQAMSQLDHTVYGVDIEGMQNAVIGLLLKKNVTLAAAESSIGGLMTQKLKDVKGSENAFVYAISASANRTKSQTLKGARAHY